MQRFDTANLRRHAAERTVHLPPPQLNSRKSWTPWPWMFQSMAWLSVLLLFVLWPIPVRADSHDSEGQHNLKIYTQNLYVGGDIARVMQVNPQDPSFPTNLIEAVTETYYEILVAQPQARMQGVAAEIAEQRPDLVSLQEVSLLRRESPGDLLTGGTQLATEVVADYLQIVLHSLAAHGVHYVVIATANEIDVEMPMLNLQTGTLDDVRLTDREVILARADHPPGHLHITNPQSGNFTHRIEIPTLGLSVLRGWCSVDVSSRGKTFRYINTHLEDAHPGIQWLQAEELLGGPGNVHMPVVLTGDFNSDANHKDGTWTYDGLIAAGFTDAWSERHPKRPGLTWGHDSLLADPRVAFLFRLDLVLVRGGHFDPEQVEIEDLRLHRKTPPLWASDHAGVMTTFHLK